MGYPPGSGSIWEVASEWEPLAALEGDRDVDVCVVGAGIAGMSTAFLLARAGKQVLVLERRCVGCGDTGVTTAHLSSAMDDGFGTLERLHGAKGLRLAWESHQAAIDFIDQTCREEGIDCDFVRLPGYLFLGPEDRPELLDRARDAAHRSGFGDVERLDSAPDALFDTGPCLRFPRQGRFHPLRYLQGLEAALRKRGGELRRAAVTAVEGGTPATVRTEDGATVRAGAIVVCTNVPIHHVLATHLKQAPYITYVIAAPLPGGKGGDALYWDTDEPYHYLRLQELDGRRMLVVGGEDHHAGEEQGTEAERWQRLEAWTRARVPIGEVTHRWSGQVMEPADGLAFIGRDQSAGDNVYVATGDSGQGITHGTIAGMLISELVQGREHAWADLYDPGRKSLRAVKDLVTENVHVARHYAEWVFGPPEAADSPQEIAAGSGAVVRRRGRPIAIYRDEQGAVHERSAVCRHLGCIVHWNNAAKSWDCPCHGSRYAPTGEVVHGPARSDLAAIDE